MMTSRTCFARRVKGRATASVVHRLDDQFPYPPPSNGFITLAPTPQHRDHYVSPASDRASTRLPRAGRRAVIALPQTLSTRELIRMISAP